MALAKEARGFLDYVKEKLPPLLISDHWWGQTKVFEVERRVQRLEITPVIVKGGLGGPLLTYREESIMGYEEGKQYQVSFIRPYFSEDVFKDLLKETKSLEELNLLRNVIVNIFGPTRIPLMDLTKKELLASLPFMQEIEQKRRTIEKQMSVNKEESYSKERKD